MRTISNAPHSLKLGRSAAEGTQSTRPESDMWIPSAVPTLKTLNPATSNCTVKENWHNYIHCHCKCRDLKLQCDLKSGLQIEKLVLFLHPTPACRTSDSTQIWAHVDWLTSTNYRADGAQDIRMCANWNQERTEQILHCLTALDSWELSSSYQLSLLKTYPQDSQNLLSTTPTPASVLIQIAKAGLVSISLTYQKNPASKLLNPMWSWVSHPEQQKADRTQPGRRHQQHATE